ncbi:PAS domain S-box protein, partial [bacterium]
MAAFPTENALVPADSPATPAVEESRLFALRSYKVIDTVPEASFDRITALAARLFDMPIALMSLVDEDRQWFKSSYGLDSQGTTREMAFCDHAIRSENVLVVNDASLDSRFADSLLVTEEPFIRFYAGAPLVNSEGYRLGTLCVIDSKPREFDASSRQTLNDLADIVVDELEYRVSTRRLLEESAARRDVQKALTETQIRFESAFHRSAIGMALFALDGHWLELNDRFCEMLGYRHDELALLTIKDITFPEDLEEDLNLMGRLLAQEIPNYLLEKRFIRADGSLIWAAISVSLVRNGAGAPLYFVKQIQDISERKRIEDDLRQSEALKTAIVDTAIDCVVTIDAEGVVLEWNPAAEKTFGYTRSEVIGKSMSELIVP